MDCAYLWWLRFEHQTSGWVDHSSKSTPSRVPHRWRVHVAIHSLPCGCNSLWKWGENLVIRGTDSVDGDLNHRWWWGEYPRKKRTDWWTQPTIKKPPSKNKNLVFFRAENMWCHDKKGTWTSKDNNNNNNPAVDWQLKTGASHWLPAQNLTGAWKKPTK